MIGRPARIVLAVLPFTTACSTARPPAPPASAGAAEIALEAAEPGLAPALPQRRMTDGDGAFYVLGRDPAKPAVRYSDGHRSLNETCAIKLGNKLNRRVPPVYVNGRPIGFC